MRLSVFFTFLLAYPAFCLAKQTEQPDYCSASFEVNQTAAKHGPFGTQYTYRVDLGTNTKDCVVVSFDLMRSYRQEDGSIFTGGIPLTLAVEGGSTIFEGEQFEKTDAQQLQWGAVFGTCRPCDTGQLADVSGEASQHLATATGDDLQKQSDGVDVALAPTDPRETVIQTIENFFLACEKGRFAEHESHFAAEAKITSRMKGKEQKYSVKKYMQMVRESGDGSKEHLHNVTVKIESPTRAHLGADFETVANHATFKGHEEFVLIRGSESEQWKISRFEMDFHSAEARKLRVAIKPYGPGGVSLPEYADSVEDLRKIFNKKYSEWFEIVGNGEAHFILLVARGTDFKTVETGSTTKGTADGYVSDSGNVSGTYREKTKKNYQTYRVKNVVVRAQWDENDPSMYQDFFGKRSGELYAWRGAAQSIANQVARWGQ